MESQTNAHDLQAKIKGFLEELGRDTDLAHKSESMQRYLEFAARFYQYSSNNVWLILMAKPEATHVAGFHTWKKMNRWVKKGEKGIAIFAPLLYKEEPDNDKSPKMLGGFRIVYVFDLSQTEGDPLPAIPDWKSPEKNAVLNEKLIAFAKRKGITVIFKDLLGDLQGVSKGGLIEMNSSAGVKTLIHEIAHELLHQGENRLVDQKNKELEAESVAFIVSKYFGISDLASPNYLALYGATQRAIMEKLEVIRSCASVIIEALLVI